MRVLEMSDRADGSNPTADAPGMAMYETTHTSILEAAKNGNMTAKKWTEFSEVQGRTSTLQSRTKVQ